MKRNHNQSPPGTRWARGLSPVGAVLAVIGTVMAVACSDDTTAPPSGGGTDDNVAQVNISVGADTLNAIGATMDIVATAENASGQTLSGITFTWSSSETTVATVSSSGLLTAVGNGSSTITASTGGFSASGTLVVLQSASAVTVTPSPTAILPSDTLQLSAAVSDANDHAVDGATVTWESSDTAVATVNASGLVTAVAPGTVTIEAVVGDATGEAMVTALSETLALMRDLLNDPFAVALLEHAAPGREAELREALDDIDEAMALGDNAALGEAIAAAQGIAESGDATDGAELSVLKLFIDYAEMLRPNSTSAQ